MIEPTSTAEPRTVESISRGYDSSIVVRRWGGAWIDFLLLAALFLIPNSVLGDEFYGRTLPVWMGLAVLYFPLTEGLTGYSLGKLVTRTKVVGSDGRPPGVWKASIRTLLRLVEVNPLLAGGLPAGVAVLVSKKRQRLGDMAAGTFVLKARDLPTIGKLSVES